METIAVTKSQAAALELQNPFENELKATNKVFGRLEKKFLNSSDQRDRAKAKKIATERQRDRHDINQRIATRRVL